MDNLFRRCLNASAVAHGAVVAAIVVSPFVLTAFRGEEPRRAPLQIYTVEVAASAPPSPAAVRDEAGSPSTPAPAPVVRQEKPIVKPKPKPLVKPAPTRPGNRTVRQQNQTTSRPDERRTTSPSGSKRPRLTEAQIRWHLSRGAVPGDETVIPADEDICFERIRTALYTAWQQPSAEESGGVVVEASITFARDGRITGWRLTRRSGIAAMDRSVIQALQAVSQITGLSPAFLRSRDTVTIEFRVGD